MTLLPWPALPPLVTGLSVHLQRELTIYERARADAALQRLRVAVEALTPARAALKRAHHQHLDLGYGAFEEQVELLTEVCEALEQIGEVPPA
jgi:hypothetical protein